MLREEEDKSKSFGEIDESTKTVERSTYEDTNDEGNHQMSS